MSIRVLYWCSPAKWSCSTTGGTSTVWGGDNMVGSCREGGFHGSGIAGSAEDACKERAQRRNLYLMGLHIICQPAPEPHGLLLEDAAALHSSQSGRNRYHSKVLSVKGTASASASESVFMHRP
ncbi:uncharacterized protein LOC126410295 [Nymphaea colorata]|uniref:uncharacterized protein LOC126410295 n=1 Tax=Nymphaea colorata TaxID=210225 RepID=UPI00214E3DF4|nr:uncharacterized protein LOC126410295 [Nymphaea colorata]